MPAFLLKKAAKKQPGFISSSPFLPDAPPSLPPLRLSTSLADPDPAPRAPPALPPAASPPVPPLPTPPEYLASDDLWDPWKTCTDAPVPRLDPVPPSGPFAPPPLLVATTPVSRPSPVVTSQSPRHIHNSVRHQPLGNQHLSQKPRTHPFSSSPPPPVLRGQTTPFDFEESLSAANVPSVVNQVRSYPPPIRHHTSPASPFHPPQMVIHPPPSHSPHPHLPLPQKPRSSSSLSSSSHNTDASRRTNGSYPTSTSASSLSPPPQVSSYLLSSLD